ncbi:MAG: molecular chaperone TorD family protein [Rhodobiaceae bacterium]|nr:molecular chaperone TorD family protein [Rhodobiaceae bacterium]
MRAGEGGAGPCAEDRLRANLYRLLAGFLARPPTPENLRIAADLEGDDSDLGRAITNFSKIAAQRNATDIASEYHDLFIGLGRGELLPYGSYYLTGFLHEKPLARLRRAMAEFGLERADSVKEPEDHIASVCDIMSELITGEYGNPVGLAEQRAFFNDHVGSWAPHFFRDLEGAKSSVLYAAIGRIGRIFMEIEHTAFSME